MPPLTVIPHFDEFEDRLTRFRPRRKTIVGALGFQGGKETLHHGIVVAVAGATHARCDLSLGEQRLVIATGVLAPAIRMVQQVIIMIALPQGHAERILNQLSLQARMHRPTHDPARVNIQHRSQV